MLRLCDSLTCTVTVLQGRLEHLEVACPGTDLGPVPGTLTTLTALRHLRLQVCTPLQIFRTVMPRAEQLCA